MKRIVALVSILSLAAAVPVMAATPTHPSHPAHPNHAKGDRSRGNGAGRGRCATLNEGYNASGKLVSERLTRGRKGHQADGTMTVDVLRANHKAPTGRQTFTLHN